ncbi:MAG: antibiotic resistance protein MarC, partial [Thermoplasmata archaeon]|nr:antibiotic resistance protein MarC [Thermoplasmata archaeon]
MSSIAFLLAVTVSLFALVDPIGTLPFFVALTQGFDDADRTVILRRAVLVVAAVLSGFALAGRFLFTAFGFTLQAFEIAGGILL